MFLESEQAGVPQFNVELRRGVGNTYRSNNFGREWPALPKNKILGTYSPSTMNWLPLGSSSSSVFTMTNFSLISSNSLWLANFGLSAFRNKNDNNDDDNNSSNNNNNRKQRNIDSCKTMLTLGARARLSLGTNVNTPFFQGPTPEFVHSARARVQGRDLVLGH